MTACRSPAARAGAWTCSTCRCGRAVPVATRRTSKSYCRQQRRRGKRRETQLSRSVSRAVRLASMRCSESGKTFASASRRTWPLLDAHYPVKLKGTALWNRRSRFFARAAGQSQPPPATQSAAPAGCWRPRNQSHLRCSVGRGAWDRCVALWRRGPSGRKWRRLPLRRARLRMIWRAATIRGA
jgi:hypothetical protein